MKWTRKLFRDLLYGGSHSVGPLEAFVLRHVREHLNPADQAAMEDQIAHVERVQRHHHERMVTIWLDAPEDRIRLSQPYPDHCLAKIKISANKKVFTVAVMTHIGLISTIEFSNSPGTCTPADIVVEDIALNHKFPGFAEAIDAEEHGR